MKWKIKINSKVKVTLTFGITILCICIFLSIYPYFRPIDMPKWMTYPYDVTIYKGEATINTYLSDKPEIKIPKRIMGAKVCTIEAFAFDNLGTDAVILDIPQSVTYALFIYHHESQSYYHLYPNNEVIMGEYIGNEKKVEIPEEVWGRKVTGIERSFAGSDIEEVVIPKTVTSIGMGTFEGCKNLKEITLPSQIEEIKACAFEKAGIKKIDLSENIKYLGPSAFAFSDINEVKGIENVEYIGVSAFRGTPWEESIEGDFVCIGDILHLYRGNDKEVIIPSSVTEIRGAFCMEEDYPYPVNVKKVFVPDSVTAISSHSFSGQDKIEVYIPSSVMTLGRYDSSFTEPYTIFSETWEQKSGTIITTAGSPAESYAIKLNIPYRIITEEEMQQEMEAAKRRLNSNS